jgi:hypothetical protein
MSARHSTGPGRGKALAFSSLGVLTRLSCWNRPRLANNLFGNGVFEAGFGLNGQPARHFLGILKYVERIDFAPSHSDNMETAVEVRGVAIQQCSRRIPLHKRALANGASP